MTDFEIKLLTWILTSDITKKEIAVVLRLLDSKVQALDAAATGDAKKVEDLIAPAFHTGVEALCVALGQ